MKITLPKLYTQLGNQTPIGNSTINNIGCLTVDAAMASTYFGHPIDPSNLAKAVIYQGNLWIWSQLSSLYPDIVYKGQIQTPDTLTDAQINQIKDYINRGLPVFILIKTPTIPEHWLLAVDYNGDDFLCADALKNPPIIHPITDYGLPPRKVIYAYAWYEGKLPVNIDALKECLAQHTVLVTENIELKKQIEIMKTQGLEKDKTISTLTTKLGQINTLSKV